MIIDNTSIIVSNSDPHFDDVQKYFVKVEDEEIKELYQVNDDGDLVIDRGLKALLPSSFLLECEDVSDHDIDVDIKSDPEAYRHILNGITLRDDQVLTVMKCLLHKRGIVQNATGSGKSICIAAILKYYNEILGYYPNTIIFEPTNYLVGDMVDRFISYGVPAQKYSDNRNIIEGVMISHPKSFLNDLNRNPDLLDGVKMLIMDETHHTSCYTWKSIYRGLSAVEVSLGFSASVIDPRRVPVTSISDLNYDEATIIGCTGNIITNFTSAYYIEHGILATPVLFRMSNPANEFVYNNRNWHELRATKLESDARTKLICRVTTTFNILQYKVLILSLTKDYAKSIMMTLYKDFRVTDCICSFGGGEYLKVDESTGEIINISDEDPKSDYESGKYKIMIGTTHIFEGVDVPNLDAVVLAEVGKQARKVIQGVGRSLCKSKTGNYAYIIDFDDYGDGILNHQSTLRYNMYEELIGVKSDFMFDHCTMQTFKSVLKALEKL